MAGVTERSYHAGMFDVHAGLRPGRPAVAALLASLFLTGTLGLAWVQVHRSRTLGPEVRLPGTPLLVRTPRGWRAAPRDPETYYLPVRQEQGGGGIDRRISFRYRRRPVFHPPLLPADADPEPVRVGRYAGWQIERIGQFIFQGHRIVRQTLVRGTLTPRGDEVTIEYEPPGPVTPADRELLDLICRAVRIDDPALRTPRELLERVGVHLQGIAEEDISGPDFSEAPGLFIQGTVGGLPAWSIGVFPTWLAGGQRPEDLLASIAGSAWLLLPDEFDVQHEQRPDGVNVARLVHPGGGRDESPHAAYLLSQDDRALLVLLFTGPPHASAARREAERLVATLILTDSNARWPPPDSSRWLATAEQAGTELASLLEREGPGPWWSREPGGSFHLWRDGPVVLFSQHRPAGRVTSAFTGHSGYLFDDSRDVGPIYAVTRWVATAGSGAYSLRLEARYPRPGGSLPLEVRQERPAGATAVLHTVRIAGRTRTESFEPGPAFIPPPLETLAESWVAQQSSGLWLIEAARITGPGTHTRLLRPLSPDPAGRRRVLVLDDFWPRGRIMAFDPDGEPGLRLEPGMRFERVSRDEALMALPRVHTLLRRLSE